MSKLGTARELVRFIRARKKWWLAPVVISLVMLGALIVPAENSALSPFIYTLF
jgi:hypothetical protein